MKPTHQKFVKRGVANVAALEPADVGRPPGDPAHRHVQPGPHLAGEITIVSILRAGLGLAEGIRELMPMAREGHIGVFRDPKSKQPQEYYVKLPEEPGRALLIDPMLATGGSAAHAIDVLIARGVPASEIRFLCLVAAPEGVSRLAEAHPEVPIVAGALDSHLDSHAYIVPGLGDAGDRLFGTL